MLEHPSWSLVLEPVQHALQPASGQSASCCLHRLPDVVDILGGMRKVENTYRIGTVVIHQSLQPLRAILHRAHLGGPFQSPPMRFDQDCFRKALSLSEARAVREVLRAHLSSLCAADLSQCQG